MALPAIYFPDEIFQTVEQAHRLVFGYGVVPWEYRLGIRSWIYPGFLAGLVWIGSAIDDAPAVYTLFVGVCLVLISLLVVFSAFLVGRYVSLTHAITAGFAAAVWFELVQQAGRTLTEVAATVPMVVALALACRPSTRWAQLFWIGFLLSLSFVLRFQLGPGLAVVGLYVRWERGRIAFTPLVLGSLIPLVAAAIVDTATWGQPFASIIRNFIANVVDGRAAAFGTSPFYHYILSIGARWLGAMPVILWLALIAARRFPVWLLAALVIMVSHSFIAHKENRFIFPAVTCLIILAGVGTGDVVDWLRRRIARPAVIAWVLPASLAAWALTSLGLSFGPYAKPTWTAGRAQLKAMHWLYRQPDLCGLGISGRIDQASAALRDVDLDWFNTGGYVHLHRSVPLFISHKERPIADIEEKYNYKLSSDPGTGGRYRRVQCFSAVDGAVCLLRRDGECEAAAGDAINEVLVKLNQ